MGQLGFSVWARNSGYDGMFPGVELKEPLQTGKQYQVEFYVSRYDSSWYAVSNMGAYFSTNQPPANIDSLNSYEPQVRWLGGFLTDSEGWTKISGEFTAQGGEQYLTIGNFDGHYGTDTLFVPGGAVILPVDPFGDTLYDYYRMSGYYIDDVSVYDVDSLTAVEEQLAISNEQLTIWPNPVGEVVRLQGTAKSTNGK